MSRAIHRPSLSLATATAQPSRGQALGHRFSVSGPAPTHCPICPNCGPTWAPERDAAPSRRLAELPARCAECTAPLQAIPLRAVCVHDALELWHTQLGTGGEMPRVAWAGSPSGACQYCCSEHIVQTGKSSEGNGTMGGGVWAGGFGGASGSGAGSGCLGWNLPQPAWKRTPLPDLSQAGQVAAPALNS